MHCNLYICSLSPMLVACCAPTTCYPLETCNEFIFVHGAYKISQGFQAHVFFSNCVPMVLILSVSSNQNVRPIVWSLIQNQTKINIKASKKWKKVYEMNCWFQNTSATKLFWAKSIVNVDGVVNKVKCDVYIRIKGHKKLLVPKLDSLWKHVGWIKLPLQW